jgi:acyl carrier protein
MSIALTIAQDRSINTMTLQDFEIPLRTKMQGTLNLRTAFDKGSLDFFIMLSSAANMIGTSGQANYNAGNAVQDALAQMSTSNNCHYLAFSPSMVEGTVAVSDNSIREALNRSGLSVIQEAEVDAMIQYMLSPDARADRLPHIAAGFDPESLRYAESINGNIRSPFFTHVAEPKRRGEMQEVTRKKKAFREIIAAAGSEEALAYTAAAVVERLASLMYNDFRSIDPNRPIVDFGLDSLSAIELKNWIKREFAVSVQSLEILNEQSLFKLAEKIVQRAA